VGAANESRHSYGSTIFLNATAERASQSDRPDGLPGGHPASLTVRERTHLLVAALVSAAGRALRVIKGELALTTTLSCRRRSDLVVDITVPAEEFRA
jgi:hypothetical protein